MWIASGHVYIKKKSKGGLNKKVYSVSSLEERGQELRRKSHVYERNMK